MTVVMEQQHEEIDSVAKLHMWSMERLLKPVVYFVEEGVEEGVERRTKIAGGAEHRTEVTIDVVYGEIVVVERHKDCVSAQQ
jgi:hypothetical protein